MEKMTFKEQQRAAKEFAAYWQNEIDSGNFKEDGKTASFWINLFSEVYGVKRPERYMKFEETFKSEDKKTLLPDVWIPAAKVIIEQKEPGFPLDRGYDRGNINNKRHFKNAYEQALKYDDTLSLNERSRYIVTSNFREFWIYDMSVKGEHRIPLKLKLQDLPNHLDTLNFLTDLHTKAEIYEEEDVSESIDAGNLVGKLYNAFVAAYEKVGALDGKGRHDINILCVRIVFCLFAEDAGIFNYAPNMFCHYMENRGIGNAQSSLRELFEVLDTKDEDRDPFLREDLKHFPYVNGGLFHDEKVRIPNITEELFHVIVDEMGKGFNWSGISPTIFGAVFESTMNPTTRRQGGMHYTSVENIHKVTKPLFLDALQQKLDEIIQIPDKEKLNQNVKKELVLKFGYRRRLEAFQDKLAALNFLEMIVYTVIQSKNFSTTGEQVFVA